MNFPKIDPSAIVAFGSLLTKIAEGGPALLEGLGAAEPVAADLLQLIVGKGDKLTAADFDDRHAKIDAVRAEVENPPEEQD